MFYGYFLYKFYIFTQTNHGGIFMLKQELKLLNRMYQDAQIGMMSIDKILKKLEDGELKRLFKKQFDMYDKFAGKCDIMAINADEELKDNSMFKKVKQTTMLYISLWTDKSPRHIVEMMITGTVMGIVDTIKAEKDCTGIGEELKVLVAEFKKMQEDFYEKLKKQLYKV